MSDTITVDGATYYRAGSGWRLRGARDVAVGPRFCALLDEIAALTQRLADAEQRTCSWRYMDWPDSESDYEGSCGYVWTFTEGGIEANCTRFCPGCGGRIVFVPPPADEDDEDAAIAAARAAEGGTPDA